LKRGEGPSPNASLSSPVLSLNLNGDEALEIVKNTKPFLCDTSIEMPDPACNRLWKALSRSMRNAPMLRHEI
jgi:hypothetical protein